MPNTFAYITLFGWPLVMLVLFRLLSLPAALISSIVAGYLLIPELVGINLPLLPTIDKSLIPSLSALILCILAGRKVGKQGEARRGVLRVRSGSPLARPAPKPGTQMAYRQSRGSIPIKLLLLLLLGTPFLTVLTNAEPLFYGARTLAGLRIYDAFSMALSAVVMVLPFLLGRRYLATPEAHVTLLRLLCLAGLAYSLPVLFEARMSPQLNHWMYGFYSHAFVQHIRADGFRPMIFLRHGLLVGIFLAATVLSTLAMWRHSRGKLRSKYLFATVWLGVVLVLSKNTGALGITLALVPVVVLLSIRGQILVAAGLAAVVLFYPILRGASLIPGDRVYAMAQSIDEARASSLKFRFDNEVILLERANEKPLFGWGIWARRQVFDPETGHQLDTTDGFWVIVIGTSGWLGYIGTFGLLCLPILLLALRRKSLGLSISSSGLAVVLAANLVDLIPNSGLTPITWLIAGALSGRYELDPIAVSQLNQRQPVDDPRPAKGKIRDRPGNVSVFQRSRHG